MKRILISILCASTLLAAANEDDPYVWMEEIEGAKALEWAKAENARSLPQLQNDKRFKGIYDDAVKILTASDRIP
ncbi:MAG: S9 family peptidase, partial [Vicinamibacterales bacterium]